MELRLDVNFVDYAILAIYFIAVLGIGFAAKRYIKSYELVTGRTFEPDTREPVARIAAALGAR